MKFEWELIDKKSVGYTERASVIGGWLVRVYSGDLDNFTICFVYDPTHEWEIE